MKSDKFNIINDLTFEEFVLKSKLPVLVEFSADWCGPSHLLEPIVDELTDEFKENVSFFKMNISQSKSVFRKYDVKYVPSFIYFDKGEAVTKLQGIKSKSDLIAFFQNKFD
jgi:thioredoxin